MDTKLTAALACAAVLALGACSGNPPPAAPGTTGSETIDPEPADPVEDGRTEAKRFDDDLEEAEADLAAARRMVTAAATTSAGIAAARKALTDAIAAARALQAPSGDSERIALAGRLDLKADAAEAEDLPRLRAAESSAGAGWAASSLVIERVGTPEVAAVRKRRRDAATTLLTEEEIPAIMYEDGKVVMVPGLGSSGDRLRMRGIPVVATDQVRTADGRRFLLMGRHLDSPRPFVDPAGGGNDGEGSRTVAGLKITPRGLVVDMGGTGAPGLDFRLPNVVTTTYGWVHPDGSNGGYDLKLEFGPPRASPEGNAEHYWIARLMPMPEHLAEPTLGSRLRDGERVVPLGTYTVRLSNHVGLDRNLEDPDDPAASARDDVNRYLSYAAYGHMEFADGFVRSVNTETIIPGRRTFPFHAGYDAFKDDTGMRTTDVADDDKITRGTFRGRTLASQFGTTRIGPWDYPALTGANYLRLRGDVQLTATISGTAEDNRISGKVTNLESFSNGKGIWEDYARISGALTLQATGIDASGEFAGVIDTASLPTFAEGGYRGNFYGPLAGLEAAGIWYLQDGDSYVSPARNLSIIGSFGAALVREDGTYGVEVGPVGG